MADPGFPRRGVGGGVPTSWFRDKNLLFDKIFAENCKKIKEIELRGGATWICQWEDYYWLAACSSQHINRLYLKRGQNVQLFICSYVAEKPGDCLYKLTCCNTKFHALFKCLQTRMHTVRCSRRLLGGESAWGCLPRREWLPRGCLPRGLSVRGCLPWGCLADNPPRTES